MRAVLRAALVVAIVVLTMLADARAGDGAGLVVFLLGALVAGVSEAVDRLGQLVAETRRQSLLLEDQRASLKRLAEVQAQAWNRRTAA